MTLWVCHYLLSHVWLFDSTDCSPPGSSVSGILQARILEWVAISFSRGSSWPRDQTWVSCFAGRFFTVWATREAPGMSLGRGAISLYKSRYDLALEPSGHGRFSMLILCTDTAPSESPQCHLPVSNQLLSRLPSEESSSVSTSINFFLLRCSLAETFLDSLSKWFPYSSILPAHGTHEKISLFIVLSVGEHLGACNHSLSHLIPKSEVSEVIQSCLTLCDIMACSLPGSSIHGILQARIPEWVTISFSRRSSRSRDRTWVSRIVGRRFTVWATREVQFRKHQSNISSYFAQALWRLPISLLEMKGKYSPPLLHEKQNSSLKNDFSFSDLINYDFFVSRDGWLPMSALIVSNSLRLSLALHRWLSKSV